MDTSLRTLQLFELKMLKDIVNVCDSNGITYYLCSGTLLGAVRHQGFIPWDDDVDIAMPYEDYKRFLKIGQELLGESYFVQSCETDILFHRAYTRIRANHTAMLNPMHKKCKTHQGVWLDIFPLVYFDSQMELTIKKKIIKISNFLQMNDFLAANIEEFQRLLGKAGMILIKALYKIPIEKRQKLHIKILDWMGKKNGKYIAEVWGNITHYYPSALLSGKNQKVLFEDSFFTTFPQYRLFLESKYGNYMKLPPVEQRKGHGGEGMIIDLEHDYSEYMDLE